MHPNIKGNIFQNAYDDNYICYLECNNYLQNGTDWANHQHYIYIPSEVRFKPMELNNYIEKELKRLECFAKIVHIEKFNNKVDELLK